MKLTLPLCLALCLTCAAASAASSQESAGGKKSTPAKKQPAASKSSTKTPAKTQPSGAAKKETAKKETANNKESATKKNADQPAKKPVKNQAASVKPAAVELSEAELRAKLDETMKLAPEERVRGLEAFLKLNPQTSARPRVLELLTAARAALADEKLMAGDVAEGIALFRLAVAEAPAEMSDRLFAGVVSQIPANLFLRGQGAAALELARGVEGRVKADPKRLLSVADFYLSVEQPEEAARVAQSAAALAPTSAAAQLALGAAHRIALRLDESAAAFRRALELDPKSSVARRNLADLERAAGRADSSLTLYRELLAADPKDRGARAGLVLSLFEAGKKEEAEAELEASLREETPNLSLLVGAAWWYVSHAQAARAEELASRAVMAEPRYTWAQVALARALVAQKRPLEAERALRLARQYGRFPTLDYELATAMAAAGLYEEAAETLAQSFVVKDGQIETRLAGRIPARAENFTELLAPERRASIFQNASADTEANARMLKGLLAFHQVMQQVGGPVVYDKDSGAAEARAFAEGGDEETRAFRQLYAANRLLRHGVGLAEVQRMTEAAMNHVDAALASPDAVVALLADELRDLRARAISSGAVTTLPEIPRNTLSNIMRGRIEDLAGWSLFIEGKAPEAVVRLKRATSVLPENSVWWRAAMWHLGAALEASGNSKEALAAYLRGYNRQSPDAARRAIIEGLYKRVHGSLEGLEEKLGPAPALASAAPTTTANDPSAPASNAPPATDTKAEPASDTKAATITTDAKPEPTPEAKPETPPKPEPTPETTTTTTTTRPTPQPSPVVETPTTTPTPTPEPTPEPTLTTQSVEPSAPTPTPAPTQTPSPTQTPAPEPTPTPEQTSSLAAQPSPTPTPEAAAKTAPDDKPKRDGAGGRCALSLSEESLSINRGGSGVVTVSLENPTRAAEVKASTANWSDIIVLAEPRADAQAGASRFTISSVSKKEGDYLVTFTSPCGTKKLSVNVK